MDENTLKLKKILESEIPPKIKFLYDPMRIKYIHNKTFQFRD